MYTDVLMHTHLRVQTHLLLLKGMCCFWKCPVTSPGQQSPLPPSPTDGDHGWWVLGIRVTGAVNPFKAPWGHLQYLIDWDILWKWSHLEKQWECWKWQSNIHTSKENKNDAVSLNQGWLLLMRTGRVVLALIVNAPEGHTGTHVSCGRWIFANK